MKLRIFIIIFLSLAFLLFFLDKKEKDILKIEIGEEVLNVWIAETTHEKVKGLSRVKNLKEVDGMIFVYKKEVIPSVWMKEMNFPIDIIWINSKKEIIEITENVSPETYPEIFSSKEPVKYVLEVSANWCEEKNIKAGDKLVYE